jgi:hypothetical protein
MRARLRDPVWWTNALQIVKTAAAAVVAWVNLLVWPPLRDRSAAHQAALDAVADAQPVVVPGPVHTTRR